MKITNWITGMMLLAMAAMISAQGIGPELVRVEVDAGDVETLRNTIDGANLLNQPTVIEIIGDAPFVFNNTVDGENYLPPIETRVTIVREGQRIRFQPGEDAPDGRFFVVRSNGNLYLERVVLEGGRSDGDGGSILVKGGGLLKMFISGIDGSEAAGRGGAIAGRSDSWISLDMVDILNSKAGIEGGGIHMQGSLFDDGSYYANNTAGKIGGSVAVSGPDSSATLNSTVVTDSQAGDDGGCAYAEEGELKLNNTMISGCWPYGVSTNGPAQIHNSLVFGNEPYNCDVRGPAPTGAHNATDDDSCGLSDNAVPLDREVMGDFFPYLHHYCIEAVPQSPGAHMNRECEDLLEHLGLRDAGSPDKPGTAEGACYPLGFNGHTTMDSCNIGPIQQDDPKGSAPTESGQFYNPEYNGVGFNFMRDSDGRIRFEKLSYSRSGLQRQSSSEAYEAGRRIVSSQGIESSGLWWSGGDVTVTAIPVMYSGRGRDRIQASLACPDDAPAGVVERFHFDEDGQVKLTEIEVIPLAQVTQPDCPDENPFIEQTPFIEQIQSGHSGGFASDDRPFDRFTLFVLLRGQALLNWMTLDAEGRPAWFFGVGDLNGDSVHFEPLYSASGPTFPDGYDPADLVIEAAGSATITFTGCDSAAFDFEVSAVDAEPGSITIVRDIGVAGTECLLAQ